MVRLSFFVAAPPRVSLSVPPSDSVNFRAIWPLQAAAACVLLAGALHFTLTPAYAQITGFTKAELGMVGSAYYVGFLAGSLLNPIVFRASGHRLLFTIYALLIAACVALQPILPGVVAWIVLRGLVGFLAAGLFAVIESWLNAIASNSNRGRTLSVYSMGNQTALAAGQYLFAAFPVESGVGFYVSAALLLLSALPMAAMKGHPPAAPSQIRVRIGALSRASPVAFAGFITNGFATSPFWVLGPVFAADAGFNQFWIGVFMSLPIFGSLAVQWPVARLSDKMDRRRIILPVALGAAIAAAVVAVSSSWGAAWAVYAGIVCFGATAMLINMLCTAHMNDRVAPEDLTEAAGASFVVYGAASAIGPISASVVMSVLGSAGLFWHAAAVLLLFGIFVATRIAVRAPVGGDGGLDTPPSVASRHLPPKGEG
jgi:MFS family permease